MSVLKKLYRNLFSNRTEQRLLFTSISPHHVVCIQREFSRRVQLLDFSRGGLAFATTETVFEVGKPVRIFCEFASDNKIAIDGEILSQHIFYPNNVEDLRHAIYRFSVKFDQRMPVEMFQKLNGLLQRCAEPMNLSLLFED